jgi:hypothetical protein
MTRLYLPAAALVLMAGPTFAQSSWPTGTTPAPALGITPTITPAITGTITLGIAAAATANDRSVPTPVPKNDARVAAQAPALPLRSSTR